MKRTFEKAMSFFTAMLMIFNVFIPVAASAKTFEVTTKLDDSKIAGLHSVLAVRFKTSDESNILLSKQDNLFAFVKIYAESPNSDEYSTQYENYYNLTQVISSGDKCKYIVPINNWYGQDGGNPISFKEGYFPLDHVQNLTIDMFIGGNGFSYNNANNNANGIKLEQGSVISKYIISFAEGLAEDSQIVEEGGKKYCQRYYDITLTPVSTSNDYNYQSILGSGIYFGITAKTITQKNDLQTNFATKTFIHEGHSITPNLSGGSTGSFYVGKVDSDIIINTNKEMPYTQIFTPDTDKVIKHGAEKVNVRELDKATIDSFVDGIIDDAKITSRNLADNPNTFSPRPNSESKLTIDTTSFGNNDTIYFDGDDLIAYINKGDFTIKKKTNQVIVFNFDSTSSITLPQYNVELYNNDGSLYQKNSTSPDAGPGAGQNSFLDKVSRTIVWNINNNATVSMKNTAGLFIAPYSQVHIGGNNGSGTSSGWLICDSFDNEGGEWHGIFADMPSIKYGVINAEKLIDSST